MWMRGIKRRDQIKLNETSGKIEDGGHVEIIKFCPCCLWMILEVPAWPTYTN